MANLNFSYSRRSLQVVFGPGSSKELAGLIDATLSPSQCLIISTPGRADLGEQLRQILGPLATASFQNAQPHVPAAVVGEALALVRDREPDCIVAVGGGSSIGLGKALAKRTGIGLVAVPTTYSGSEMTDIWGVTDGKRKQTGRDPSVAPSLVVYDPELTFSLPPRVSGPSGMNAIAHAVEALYSPQASPVSSMLAQEGIRLLSESLPVIVQDQSDLLARSNAMCGAHFCGNALDMTSMGLHHKLCHALGGLFDLPHAMTHAVLLPYVCAYNAPAVPDAMRSISQALGEQDAPDGIWHLNTLLGITQTLGDLGLSMDSVEQVVHLVVNATYPNPVPVTNHGMRQLLQSAIRGDPLSST